MLELGSKYVRAFHMLGGRGFGTCGLGYGARGRDDLVIVNSQSFLFLRQI